MLVNNRLIKITMISFRGQGVIVTSRLKTVSVAVGVW